MPFDSEGVFSRLHNWEDDRTNDIDIVSDRHDEEDDNFADGLSQCFLKNGNSKMEGNFNVGNFKVMNVADGTLSNDAVNRKQLNAVESRLTETVATAKSELEESLETAKTELSTSIESSVANLGNDRIGFPSYKDFIDISSGFTAEESGWVFISFYHSSDGNNTLTVAVNDVTIGGFQSHDYDNQNIIMPLKKGDVLTFSGANIRFSKFCSMR